MARRNLSQTILAERLDMTQQALSRRISGQTAFKVDEIQHIAQALKVPVCELINDDTAIAS
jgi:transcriptional regulator with XRE-family HTH domain